MDNEIWRYIPEYEALYQVSNIGRIKSLHKQVSEKVLNNQLSNGYLTVGLSKNGKTKYFKVHRLVALAFIPNPDNKRDIDHIDLNKINNNVNNLRWSSRSENNINKKAYSNTGKKFIYKKRNSFKVQFKNISETKTFKTLEEAIQYRNEWFENNNIIFDNDKYDL